VQRNFHATLATFVSFEVAWTQTIPVVSCDRWILYDMFDQYKNWPISLC